MGSNFLWNAFSVVVLAISGLLLNYSIVNFSGLQHLGVFHQVYAIYMILSHFSVFGIHYSILQDISHNQNDTEYIKRSFISGLFLALITSLIISIVAYYFSNLVGDFFNAKNVGKGIKLIVPGLIFLSLNKIFLNVINALNHMRAHAIFVCLRYLLILVIGLIIITYNSGTNLALTLTISEFLLLIMLCTYHKAYVLNNIMNTLSKKFIVKHYNFGKKSFLGGALVELNIKIDTLSIGYFLNDFAVGIYGFASLFAEGLSQLPMVMRKNIDPLIGDYFAKNQLLKIEKLSKEVKSWFAPIMFFLCCAVILCFPFLIKILKIKIDENSLVILVSILATGIAINSLYHPFNGIFLQGKKPGTNTIIVVIIMLFNILGNIVLIPILDIFGAAISTSLTHVLEMILIVGLSRILFKIKL